MGLTPERPIGRRVTTATKVLLSLVVVGVLGSLAGGATMAAFGSATSTRGGFAAGTVYLTGDSGRRPMFLVENASPGSTATSYTTVSYQGTLPAGTRLYGTTSGTGLSRFLTLTVTRGTGSGPGFVPDPIDYAGAGPGVLYRGTLAAFPSDWQGGVADPGTWQQGESHSYRFEVRMGDDPGAQGLTADASFLWEARNL